MPTPRSRKLGFSVSKLRPLYVTEANGKVVAVQIPIADWIAFWNGCATSNKSCGHRAPWTDG